MVTYHSPLRGHQEGFWENVYIELFSGKLSNELLDRSVFSTLIETSVLIEQWSEAI